MTTSVICPSNVSNMTFVGSGSLPAVAGMCSGMTDAEATRLVDPNEQMPMLITTDPVTGVTTIRLPPGLLTAITINGQVYNPDPVTGFITGVPAADATSFLTDQGDATFKISVGA